MRFLKHELSRARVVRFRMVRHIESEKMRQIAEKGEKGGKLEGPTSKKKEKYNWGGKTSSFHENRLKCKLFCLTWHNEFGYYFIAFSDLLLHGSTNTIKSTIKGTVFRHCKQRYNTQTAQVEHKIRDTSVF